MSSRLVGLLVEGWLAVCGKDSFLRDGRDFAAQGRTGVDIAKANIVLACIATSPAGETSVSFATLVTRLKPHGRHPSVELLIMCDEVPREADADSDGDCYFLDAKPAFQDLLLRLRREIYVAPQFELPAPMQDANVGVLAHVNADEWSKSVLFSVPLVHAISVYKLIATPLRGDEFSISGVDLCWPPLVVRRGVAAVEAVAGLTPDAPAAAAAAAAAAESDSSSEGDDLLDGLRRAAAPFQAARTRTPTTPAASFLDNLSEELSAVMGMDLSEHLGDLSDCLPDVAAEGDRAEADECLSEGDDIAEDDGDAVDIDRHVLSLVEVRKHAQVLLADIVSPAPVLRLLRFSMRGTDVLDDADADAAAGSRPPRVGRSIAFGATAYQCQCFIHDGRCRLTLNYGGTWPQLQAAEALGLKWLAEGLTATQQQHEDEARRLQSKPKR